MVYSVHNKCNGEKYSSEYYGCCGSAVFSLSSQRCQSGVIETECGSKWYNSSTQFCYSNSIYDKCNGQTYSPETQRCQSNVIETKCGSNWYNSETQFCWDNKVYDLCSGKKYDLSNQRCENNVVETKCGGNWHVLNSNQHCSNNNVITGCGNSWYDASNSNLRCWNNVVETKCGNDWHNPATSTQYCKNGTTLAQYGSLEYAGQTYRTVEIGTQIWMAENLNYNASNSKCFKDSEDNCTTYGRLYDWLTAMNGATFSNTNPSGIRGVCPSGWHLPSDDEWATLTDFVGGSAGTKLKATSGWNSYNGTDDYGFSALPGGCCSSFPDYGEYFIGSSGSWWSTTKNTLSYEGNDYTCKYMAPYYYYIDLSAIISHKANLFCSVRCVQD